MNTSDHKDNPDKIDTPVSASATAHNIPLHDNRIDSRDLFVAGREIIISHGSETYRLRLTALNKLILTK